MISGYLHEKHRIPGAANLASIIAFLTACLICQGGPVAGTAKPAQELKPGVVVEKIENSGEARTAGIQEGDVLLSWAQADGSGKIESPFDLVTVELEQKPQGAITLQGLRGTQKQSWHLGPDVWGIKTRPDFSEPALSIYRATQPLTAAGKSTEAAEHWRALADSPGPGPTWLRAWLAFRSAEWQAEAGQWKEADRAFQEAVQSATAVGPGATTQVLRAWGKTFEQRSDWASAEKYYTQALEEAERASPATLSLAMDLDNLGNLAFKASWTKQAAISSEPCKSEKSWRPKVWRLRQA